MKKLILVIFFLTLAGSASAIPEGDSLKTKDEKTEKKIEEKPDSSVKQNKKKDVFIDKDGDGICDNRANGMSFEKFRKRHQFKKGGKGPGGRK